MTERVAHLPPEVLLVFEPALREIFPSRVHRFNERNLLGPAPPLDLFLSGDRVVRSVGCLDVDEARNRVTVGEPRPDTGSMMQHASCNVVCHSDIQRARSIGEDVHLESPRHAGNMVNPPLWTATIPVRR